ARSRRRNRSTTSDARNRPRASSYPSLLGSTACPHCRSGTTWRVLTIRKKPRPWRPGQVGHYRVRRVLRARKDATRWLEVLLLQWGTHASGKCATRFWTTSSRMILYVVSLNTVLRQTHVIPSSWMRRLCREWP